MGAKSKKIARVETRNFPVYDTTDLELFQKVLNDIIHDAASAGSLSIKDREYLRVKLATAIFKRAEAGERDYARLRRGAVEAVSAAPPPDPGS
jgi:hypothetical protein